MKKRLVKKAFSRDFYHFWTKPGTDTVIPAPRNGRCWCIIQRAFQHLGHPECAEQMTDAIVKAAEE